MQFNVESAVVLRLQVLYQDAINYMSVLWPSSGTTTYSGKIKNLKTFSLFCD